MLWEATAAILIILLLQEPGSSELACPSTFFVKLSSPLAMFALWPFSILKFIFFSFLLHKPTGCLWLSVDLTCFNIGLNGKLGVFHCKQCKVCCTALFLTYTMRNFYAVCLIPSPAPTYSALRENIWNSGTTEWEIANRSCKQQRICLIFPEMNIKLKFCIFLIAYKTGSMDLILLKMFTFHVVTQ